MWIILEVIASVSKMVIDRFLFSTDATYKKLRLLRFNV